MEDRSEKQVLIISRCWLLFPPRPCWPKLRNYLRGQSILFLDGIPNEKTNEAPSTDPKAGRIHSSQTRGLSKEASREAGPQRSLFVDSLLIFNPARAALLEAQETVSGLWCLKRKGWKHFQDPSAEGVAIMLWVGMLTVLSTCILMMLIPREEVSPCSSDPAITENILRMHVSLETVFQPTVHSLELSWWW